MSEFYTDVCNQCSSLITKKYSTSFSMGIRLFKKNFRAPIYGIYGYVRLADEIVDTFHDHDKNDLLGRFEKDTFQAIEEGISLNPVLQSFQHVVNEYNIDKSLIEAFFESMKMDLYENRYGDELYQRYIYGSAEVIGLMCLKIFCEKDEVQFERLKYYAQKLGAAFQKVNFLRDIKSDYTERGRVYFPGVNFQSFDVEKKVEIERDIQADFDEALSGIKLLPKGARCGVYLAYVYYLKLFRKIKKASPERVIEQRLRINDGRKIMLLFSSFLRHRLNLL